MTSPLSLIFSNNAQATLATGISSTATALQLTGGEGSLFPAVSSASRQAFRATIIRASDNTIFEIIQCTVRTGDNFATIQRSIEGPAPRAWSAGDIVALLPTAFALNTFLQAPQGQAQPFNYAPDAGAANAYIVALDPPLQVHVVGMPIRWKALHSCTGASTFSDGVGIRPIATPEGFNTQQGDIVAGGLYECQWDGTNFQLVSVHHQSFGQVSGQVSNGQVPVGAVTQWQASLALAWSQITSGKPTTVAGYGITDALTLANFPRSLVRNGYQVIPGGWTYQQGLCNPNGGSVTVTFPLAFPGAVFAANATGSTAITQSNVTNLTTTQITVQNTGGQSYFSATGA